MNGTLKYEASIPGMNCQIEYTCEPEKGDLLMTMLGDEDLVRFYYDQSKAAKTWQDCHSLDNTEHCSSYENIEGYPLKMQLTISLVNYDTVSIYTLHRVIIPK